MTNPSRVFVFILPFAAALSLAGCFGGGMEELQAYIEAIKARPPRAIEPLPQIQQIESFVYNARGRRSPFSSDFGTEEFAEGKAAGEGVRPDLMRRKEELEQFPLDTLRMVGTLAQDQKTWALVLSQDGVIHRVQPGNYLGLNNGQITHISEEKVELTEITPDGDGGYQERQAVLTLGGETEGKGK
ncbi:MAG: pilus assembly protein PilP [Gammaproteobacteria bacterium]|nr:pilus assembly protein PilP [Gammaproteobacteria bacterium]MBU1653799.1 pilus assembly protein PilP [Gammaproteobacteria bacterium]MBU1961711.1 pilus assembly protein PilP [Gammaproteobacteria bacterium]